MLEVLQNIGNSTWHCLLIIMRFHSKLAWKSVDFYYFADPRTVAQFGIWSLFMCYLRYLLYLELFQMPINICPYRFRLFVCWDGEFKADKSEEILWANAFFIYHRDYSDWKLNKTYNEYFLIVSQFYFEL